MNRAARNLSPLALALMACAGCSTMAPREFADSRPAFQPERYFEGTTTSQGFYETRGGQPRAPFSTRATGRRAGDALALRQVFTDADGRKQTREWQIRRLAAGRYEATANDVVGVARGEVHGATFHWRYTVALSPGNPLSHVALEQWMSLQPDGRTVLNRALIRKWGVRVGMVSEVFKRGE